MCAQNKIGRPLPRYRRERIDHVFRHDPALADKRTAARRRGGEQKRHAVLGPDEPKISLRSCSDACELTNRLIDHLLRGEADPKVTNSVLGLLNFWQGAYKTEISSSASPPSKPRRTGDCSAHRTAWKEPSSSGLGEKSRDPR